jgi:hypothetical protein
MKKCNCKNNGDWMECPACNGRIHLDAKCTSWKKKAIDCCEARHEMLRNEGHEYGLSDSGVKM